MAIRENTKSISELAEAQKITQGQLSDPEDGLIAVVRQLAKDRQADRDADAALHKSHQTKFMWIFRMIYIAFGILATAEVLNLFPGLAKAMSLFHP